MNIIDLLPNHPIAPERQCFKAFLPNLVFRVILRFFPNLPYGDKSIKRRAAILFNAPAHSRIFPSRGFTTKWKWSGITTKAISLLSLFSLSSWQTPRNARQDFPYEISSTGLQHFQKQNVMRPRYSHLSIFVPWELTHFLRAGASGPS